MSKVLKMSSLKLARTHKQINKHTRSLLELGPPTKKGKGVSSGNSNIIKSGRCYLQLIFAYKLII